MVREYFTVDLRGLRAALIARAAEAGMTECDVLRSALATTVNGVASSPAMPSSRAVDRAPSMPHVKLSVRLSHPTAHRLNNQARSAGLSRGAYLTRLIEGSPIVVASADLQAGFAALSASATELAVLSRDISHLTQLLRTSEFRPALEYRERLETLDDDVRKHLDLAAVALAEVSGACPARVLRTGRPRSRP